MHSDAFSVLLSIKSQKVHNPLITNPLNSLNSKTLGKKVVFCWIPSHTVIQGNHKAESIAKYALNMVLDNSFKIPYTNLKPQIRQIPTNK